MKMKLIATFLIIFVGIIFLSFTYEGSQTEPWEVPAKYEKMTNPQDADKASLKEGKKIYNKHCKSCHGSEGLGDGSKAAQLDTPCGDFTADSFVAQSDGSLFYKSKIGRDEMPSFEKKIPYDEDIWHVVNYMRTMAE